MIGNIFLGTTLTARHFQDPNTRADQAGQLDPLSDYDKSQEKKLNLNGAISYQYQGTTKDNGHDLEVTNTIIVAGPNAYQAILFTTADAHDQVKEVYDQLLQSIQINPEDYESSVVRQDIIDNLKTVDVNGISLQVPVSMQVFGEDDEAIITGHDIKWIFQVDQDYKGELSDFIQDFVDEKASQQLILEEASPLTVNDQTFQRLSYREQRQLHNYLGDVYFFEDKGDFYYLILAQYEDSLLDYDQIIEEFLDNLSASFQD